MLRFTVAPTPVFNGKPMADAVYSAKVGPFTFVLSFDPNTKWNVSWQDTRVNPRSAQFIGQDFATRAMAEGAASAKAKELLAHHTEPRHDH